MPKDIIHPNPASGGDPNNGYAAGELTQLKVLGFAYYVQLTKAFGIANHTSVQAPPDYVQMAAAFGVTEAQATELWNRMNGAIQAFEGPNKSGDNYFLTAAQNIT